MPVFLNENTFICLLLEAKQHNVHISLRTHRLGIHYLTSAPRGLLLANHLRYILGSLRQFKSQKSSALQSSPLWAIY